MGAAVMGRTAAQRTAELAALTDLLAQPKAGSRPASRTQSRGGTTPVQRATTRTLPTRLAWQEPDELERAASDVAQAKSAMQQVPTGKKQRPELPRLAGAADLLNDLISSQKKVSRR